MARDCPNKGSHTMKGKGKDKGKKGKINYTQWEDDWWWQPTLGAFTAYQWNVVLALQSAEIGNTCVLLDTGATETAGGK